MVYLLKVLHSLGLGPEVAGSGERWLSEDSGMKFYNSELNLEIKNEKHSHLQMARIFCRSQIPGVFVIHVVPDFALLKIYEKLLSSFSSLFLLDQLQNLKCRKERKAYIFNEFNI